MFLIVKVKNDTGNGEKVRSGLHSSPRKLRTPGLFGSNQVHNYKGLRKLRYCNENICLGSTSRNQLLRRKPEKDELKMW